MRLTAEEQSMASGDEGPAAAFAMNLLIRAGEMLGADSFVPIQAAYVNTCFAIIEPHFDLIKWLADRGAKVRVPTFTSIGVYDADNPLLRTDESGKRAGAQTRALMDLHKAMGCTLAMTCAPYQLPNQPGLGAHIVSSESSAISYFNSVLGARTLKYGDYLDIAAAIVGRAPFVGLHTYEGRRATVVLEIASLPTAFAEDDLSYQLIGHVMGRKAGADVPVLVGLSPSATPENLRSVSATGASSGGVALYHAVGLTPEAATLEIATGGIAPKRRSTITSHDLAEAKRELTHFRNGPINAVVIGTPHAPLSEIAHLAKLIDGKQVHEKVVFYVQMNRFVLEQACRNGLIDTLHRGGITPVTDTCLYWRPNVQGITGRVMTNSGKYAYYAPGELGINATIGSLKECVESAVRGSVWTNPAMDISA